MATVPPNRRIERAGVNALRSFLDEHDHLVQEIADGTDHGEDCFVMLTRQRKRTGYSFTAQVKAGKKYKRARGYAIPVGHHFTDWKSSKVPVIGVVYDVDEQRMFWINLTLHLNALSIAPSWVPVPRENELCTASIDAFIAHIEEFTDAPEKCLAGLAGSDPVAGTPSHARPGRGRASVFRAPVLQWTKATAASDAWQPQVVEGYAVVRHNHLIRVFDAVSGAEAWSARTAFNRISPFGDEAVYASATAGRLRALTLASGRTRWEQSLRVRDDLAVYASKSLYAPDEEGRIYALDTRSGKLRWVSPPDHQRLVAPILVNDDAVCTLRTASPGSTPSAESAGREVVVLATTDGAEIWRHRADAAVSLAWTLADGVLYIVERPDGDSSVLVALELGSGRPLWRSPLPAPVSSAAVASGEYLYVSGRRGGLYRISRTDGACHRSDTAAPLAASPVVADGTVVVNMGRALAAFDAADSTPRWVRRLPGLALGQPFVLRGAVCIGHRAGVLACDIQTGRRLWSDELTWDPEVQGEPATTRNALYITDRRGVVHSFRTA
ncbi:PQQ-binding-like beta-propeller repeat protein [Streptomyces sp. NPDC090499]|uniref:outer membrane protein assembly factor BamB family protein n=1 Tax=Streptomyces sp. NPDC090499 TaxID=3365965 RepID=UPI0038032B78